MRNRINIAKYLKNCVSYKLYSPLFSEFKIFDIGDEAYPIQLLSEGVRYELDAYGHLKGFGHQNCVIFPSKDYCSWEGVSVMNGELIIPEIKPQPTYGKYYCYGANLMDKSMDIQEEFEKLGAKNVDTYMYLSPELLYYIDNVGNINIIREDCEQLEQELIAQGYKELELGYKPKDKELVWCWDNVGIANRIIGFYDAKNNCVFAYNGKRHGPAHDNYKPYKGPHPEWAKEAFKHLED